MLVPKSLWTLHGSITSCLQPRKAGHFPKAGAVPSVFSFRPPMSPKWEYEARRRIERKRDVCPRRHLCDKWWSHSLSEAGRKRGEEVTTQAKFVPGGFFVFSGCTWKSTGFVHAVCMRGEDWEILGVQEARLSWTAIDCILFSFQVLFQTSDNPTWVSRIQTQTRDRTQNSHRDTGGIRGVYCGRWRCMHTYHSRNSAFLTFSCGLFFF